MVSPLGAASGNAMEAVHNNAQGAIIDDSLKH